VEDKELCGVPRGNGQGRRAPFERRYPRLKHRLGGVHDAGVNVSERLQAEQGGSVVRVVEDIRSRLVDRRHACAGGRVGRRAGMDGERGEPWGAGLVGHAQVPP